MIQIKIFALLLIGVLASLLLCLSVHFIIRPKAYASLNTNAISARVRDEEEIRLAAAISKIAKWRSENSLPMSELHFATQSSDPFRQSKYSPVNFLILILTADRVIHAIDAFESYYATQSVTNVLHVISLAEPQKYPLLGTVKISVCVVTHENDSNSRTFSGELSRIVSILGKESVLNARTVKSGKCQPILDFNACFASAVQSMPSISYITFLEDDFLIKTNFLPTIHKYLNSNKLFEVHRDVFIQLYTEADTKPQDSNVDRVVFFLYFLTNFPMLFICYRLRRYVIVRIFILTSLLLLTSCVCNHFLSSTKLKASKILDSVDPAFSATGSAFLISRNSALNLINSSKVSGNHCELFSKSEYISSLLNMSGLRLFAAHPAIVEHIGMYSHVKQTLNNPLLFAH